MDLREAEQLHTKYLAEKMDELINQPLHPVFAKYAKLYPKLTLWARVCNWAYRMRHKLCCKYCDC